MSDQRRITVIAAKLNVNLHLFCSSVEEGVKRVCKVLLSHTHEHDIRSGKFVWGLRDVITVDHQRGQLIGGKLFKMRSKEMDIVTETSVNKKTFDNLADAVSVFLFDPSTETVLFEDKHPTITPSMFCRMFAQLASQTDSSIRNAVTVYPKPVKGAFLTFLRSGARVRMVKFRLSPANGTVDWNEIERELSETRATQILREYRSDAEGLQVNGTALEALARYVDNGWAEGRAVVEDNNGIIRRKSSQELILRMSLLCNGDEQVVQYYKLADLLTEAESGGGGDTT